MSVSSAAQNKNPLMKGYQDVTNAVNKTNRDETLMKAYQDVTDAVNKINRDETLMKAYQDVTNAVNKINRDVTFYNIKTVVKVSAFSAGYLITWANTALLGAAGYFFAVPLVIMLGVSIVREAMDQIVKRDYDKKCQELVKARQKTLDLVNIITRRAIKLEHLDNGFFPYTFQKISIDPYDAVKQRYDAIPCKWVPRSIFFE